MSDLETVATIDLIREICSRSTSFFIVVVPKSAKPDEIATISQGFDGKHTDRAAQCLGIVGVATRTFENALLARFGRVPEPPPTPGETTS